MLDEKYRRTKCLGTALQIVPLEGAAVSKLVKPCDSLVRTCQESDHSYGLPIISPTAYHPHSGTDYSKVNPSTLTKSSRQCILSNLMKREKEAWEQLRSYLRWQSPNDKSEQGLSGPQHLEDCRRQSRSFSPTEGRSCLNMRNISRDSSQQKRPVPIQGSSSMTSQFATKLVEARTLYSPTITASTVSVKPYSMPMELNMIHPQRETDRKREDQGSQVAETEQEEAKRTSVEDSTVKEGASSEKRNVIINIPARGAKRMVTESPTAMQKNIRKATNGMVPKYLHYNVWDPKSDFSPNTANWTEKAEPLAGVPLSELENDVVTKTINENPHLFCIVTPIRVEIYESYLSTHPNQAFILSVCRGLREGFWPWASTSKPGYPVINDEAKPVPTDKLKANFLRSQRDVEVTKGRFSSSFGRSLLPGMYSMPSYAVPKPNSSDFCLVTDQSCGKHSLNGMIQHDKVTGYPLDNMVHYGKMLMDLAKKEPEQKRVVWKSDIAKAYRILPMHPRWQIKQVNTIDGERYIDRCNTFGGCASRALFIAFNSLVAWIAKWVKGIRYLGNYVDDTSGCGLEKDYVPYKPYHKLYPRDQVTLLKLWDELGIPHKEKKQIHGSPLPISDCHG